MGIKEAYKSLARVEAGHRNVLNGKAVEEIVKSSCARYREHGIAFITKNSEPVQNLGPVGAQGGVYLMRYAQKAKPDFEGVLKGGRAILFDVKSTTQASIRASVVTKGQADCLDQYEKLGAISAVLVCINFTDFYFVPWDIWKNMKLLFGHKHMTEEDLALYKVPYDEKSKKIWFLNSILGERKP